MVVTVEYPVNLSIIEEDDRKNFRISSLNLHKPARIGARLDLS